MAPARSSRGHRPQPGLLSIGALSAATGIPPETIRTWERRYGFPAPVRKPSGHRLYPLGTLPRLRRVAQAIASGHRAAEVLPASESDLDALLASVPQVPSRPPQTPAPAPAGGRLDAQDSDLLDAVRSFDAERLRRQFQLDWARLGPVEFLEQRAAAFLTSIGNAWAEGSLEVRHEHFGSAILGDFLRTVRAPLENRAAGPIVALATLPGELHGLGLQMAALVFTLAGWRSLVLGVDTPVSQIAALAREAPLAAVALSLVQPDAEAVAMVRGLRRKLRREVHLIIGGTGASALAGQRGIETVTDLTGLDQWLRSRRAS